VRRQRGCRCPEQKKGENKYFDAQKDKRDNVWMEVVSREEKRHLTKIIPEAVCKYQRPGGGMQSVSVLVRPP